jgi:hypothetical protein
MWQRESLPWVTKGTDTKLIARVRQRWGLESSGGTQKGSEIKLGEVGYKGKGVQYDARAVMRCRGASAAEEAN